MYPGASHQGVLHDLIIFIFIFLTKTCLCSNAYFLRQDFCEFSNLHFPQARSTLVRTYYAMKGEGELLLNEFSTIGIVNKYSVLPL